ncbi:MAG: hypothetical protein K0S33_2654 [Bacteroidetes bacterium]|jgi:hypothetical protein|nr:hypothetical protein [Bacteroidota bacterium]
MKRTILLLSVCTLVIIGISSCGNQATSPESLTAVDSTTTDSVVTAEVPKSGPGADVLGIYAGAFNAAEVKKSRAYHYMNKINVSIDSIGDGKIKGHSVVAGNNRPFSGTYEVKNNVYIVQASEPGDDKYDGKFSFTLDPALHVAEGTWEANNKKLEVVKRSYKLNAATFAYDANNALSPSLIGNFISDWQSISQLEEEGGELITSDAMKINPSVTKLKTEDVENMYKGDLEVMRNSIYARHGYSFKNRRMRYIFDNSVDWYIPVTTNVQNDLTALEKENIALIKRYEEHAENYYDSYGR